MLGKVPCFASRGISRSGRGSEWESEEVDLGTRNHHENTGKKENVYVRSRFPVREDELPINSPISKIFKEKYME